jgi:hypothetical protein
MNEASRYLQTLARRVAAAYVAHTQPRAMLLTGSAAAGASDSYSDLDLVAYYDERPTEAQRAAARKQVERQLRGAQLARRHAFGGDWYAINGVHCEIGYLDVRSVERDLTKVLEEHDPDPLLQKALCGLLQGVPLHGEDLIRGWQARAATYPEGLARAMVERHLRFLPIWWAPGYFAARDATVFFHQSAVDACLNVLGVLAGLNRQYYSTFQFKRMRAFVGALHLTPPDLANRIEGVLASIASDPVAAGAALEALVSETVGLIETHMPEVDTSMVRHYLGQRFQQWQPVPREAP